ncbi:MAG: efflux RND transporter periplasmic adaptor subunit [Candidatus Polarisedimenticolia bacterium]
MHVRRSLAAALWAALAVLTATPARADKYECLVEPYMESKIGVSVPGILDEVKVDRGDFVKKGQVLFTLQAGVERAAYDLAKQRSEFATRKMERNKELYRKQMISIHERDELATEAQLLKLEEREAEERLKLRIITSPIDGVVVKRMFHPGERVEEQPVLELAQIHPLRVEAVVPMTLYRRVKVGMVGQVEWEASIGGTNNGTVTIVDPVVDAASGTIGVRLEVPNPTLKLAAGAKCLVTFPVADSGAAGK